MRMIFDCQLQMALNGRIPGFVAQAGDIPGIDQSSWVVEESICQISVEASEESFPKARDMAAAAAELIAVSRGLPPDWIKFGQIVAKAVNVETLDFAGALEPANPAIRCPKCNSPMVRRRGRSGLFWGCSNYSPGPSGCRGHRPISE